MNRRIAFYKDRFVRATDEAQKQERIALDSANAMIDELVKSNRQLVDHMRKEDLQKAADEFCHNPTAPAVKKLKAFLRANFLKGKRLHLTCISSQIHYTNSAELVGIYATWQVKKKLFYTLFIPCFEYLTADELNVNNPIFCGQYVLLEPSNFPIARSNRTWEASWYPEDIEAVLVNAEKGE